MQPLGNKVSTVYSVKTLWLIVECAADPLNTVSSVCLHFLSILPHPHHHTLSPADEKHPWCLYLASGFCWWPAVWAPPGVWGESGGLVHRLETGPPLRCWHGRWAVQCFACLLRWNLINKALTTLQLNVLTPILPNCSTKRTRKRNTFFLIKCTTNRNVMH